MADAIPIPRSGIWHLRSKRDHRWNCTGQYSSLDWELSPWPEEAQQAVEERKASLGEAPPEDLSCVTVPYPSPSLRRLFESHIFEATEKQGTFYFLAQESGLSQLISIWRKAR
jgi:hypothetical protein